MQQWCYRGEKGGGNVVKELTRLWLLITGQSKVGGEIQWFKRVESPDAKLPVGERQPSPEACIATAFLPALADLTRPHQVPRVIQVSQNLKDHLCLQSVIPLSHSFLFHLFSLFSFFQFSLSNFLHFFLSFLSISLSLFYVFLLFF